MKQLTLGKIASAMVVAGTLSFALVGTAQAVTTTLGALTPGATLTDGKVTLSNFAFSLGDADPGPAVDPGNFNLADPVSFFFDSAAPNYYTFSYTPSGPRHGAGTLTYTATINDPDYMFHSATVGLLGSSPDPAVRHISLTEAGSLMSPIPLTSPGGTAFPPAHFISGVSVANLSTTWYVPVGETITALNNQLAIQQVPAPLPILGALAAVGWSRQLRRRIRVARPAGVNADRGLALAA